MEVMIDMGGYVTIDATGVNLLAESKTTVEGIFAKVVTAYNTGKMCLAEGCTWGTVPTSPIPVMVLPLDGKYTCTACTLQLTVDPEDGVTVLNLAPSNAKKGGSK